MKQKGILLLAFSLLLIISLGIIVSAQVISDTQITYDRYFKRGVYYFNNRDYTAAVINFQNALSAIPDDRLAQKWIGRSYLHSGYLNNALMYWERALEKDPFDTILKDQINGLLFSLDLPPIENRQQNYIPFAEFNFSQLQQQNIHPTSFIITDNNTLVISSLVNKTLYVIDNNGYIQTSFTLPFEETSAPFDIAMDDQQNYYISDYGNNSIIKLSPQLDNELVLGGIGIQPGQFLGPMGLFISDNNHLYVVDNGNGRIQKFDLNGRLIGVFSSQGYSAQQLNNPTDIIIHKDVVYVSDTGNGRLSLFDIHGNFIENLGSYDLDKPRGLALLNDNTILICDESKGVITFNIPTGQFQILVDAQDMDNKLNYAMNASIDNNSTLYVSDFASNKINLYIPEDLRNVNLQISITQTYNSNFPTVVHKVKVRDRYNSSIDGLTRENFHVFDNQMQMLPIGVRTFEEHNNNQLSLVFLNDKTTGMEPYENLRNTIARSLVSDLQAGDQVKVISFSDHIWTPQNYVYSNHLPVAALADGEYSDGNQLSLALYQAISDCHHQETKRAVVLFISQNPDIDDFTPHRMEDILLYAKINDVPIYVISFLNEDSNSTNLQSLASLSGGQYFNAITSNEVYDLVPVIRNNPITTYLIAYELPDDYYRTNNGYHEVLIHVNYRNLFGKDQTGYFELW